MFLFEKYHDEIGRICWKYHVKSLVAFGSSLSDEFDDHSDLDFLLELFEPKDGLSNYMNIKFELESLFGRSVDIVMPKAIRNELMKNYIFSNTRELYAA